jgi:predicted metal-dependent phosphoesterase TrpH|tara:strand:- start:3363 stop:4001 length:639 start_codon:yes stop_codon:yes gene_type:complete
LIIDLHTHTYPTSDDSRLTPDELISEAKRIGLDGICITDHDGFWKPKDIEKLADKYKFTVLPGCEVTTEEGHLLVYGLKKYIFGMHKASFVKKLIDKENGAIVVAHPYRRNYSEYRDINEVNYKKMLNKASKNPVFKLSDAIEEFNGKGSKKENKFSSDLTKKLKMNGTGASDAHQIEHIGTFATEFFNPIQNIKDLIREIKSGNFRSVKLK